MECCREQVFGCMYHQAHRKANQTDWFHQDELIELYYEWNQAISLLGLPVFTQFATCCMFGWWLQLASPVRDSRNLQLIIPSFTSFPNPKTHLPIQYWDRAWTLQSYLFILALYSLSRGHIWRLEAWSLLICTQIREPFGWHVSYAIKLHDLNIY